MNAGGVRWFAIRMLLRCTPWSNGGRATRRVEGQREIEKPDRNAVQNGELQLRPAQQTRKLRESPLNGRRRWGPKKKNSLPKLRSARRAKQHSGREGAPSSLHFKRLRIEEPKRARSVETDRGDQHMAGCEERNCERERCRHVRHQRAESAAPPRSVCERVRHSRCTLGRKLLTIGELQVRDEVFVDYD